MNADTLRAVCNCAPDCAERIACLRAGEPGHLCCGWCVDHNEARHVCLCRAGVVS